MRRKQDDSVGDLFDNLNIPIRGAENALRETVAPGTDTNDAIIPLHIWYVYQPVHCQTVFWCKFCIFSIAHVLLTNF